MDREFFLSYIRENKECLVLKTTFRRLFLYEVQRARWITKKGESIEPGLNHVLESLNLPFSVEEIKDDPHSFRITLKIT